MPPDDLVRFRHMLEAAQNASDIARSRRREDLEDDPLLALALTRLVEIVGEAASRITRMTRDAYPQFPWRDMITMRNRLIHAYHDISLDILWQTVIDDLPLLIALIEPVIPQQ